MGHAEICNRRMGPAFLLFINLGYYGENGGNGGNPDEIAHLQHVCVNLPRSERGFVVFIGELITELPFSFQDSQRRAINIIHVREPREKEIRVENQTEQKYFRASQQASPQITPVLEEIQSDEGQEVLEQGGSEPTKSQPHTSTPSAPGDDEIEGEWAS